MSLRYRKKCGFGRLAWLALAIALVLASWACRSLPELGDRSGEALPERLPEAAEVIRFTKIQGLPATWWKASKGLALPVAAGATLAPTPDAAQIVARGIARQKELKSEVFTFDRKIKKGSPWTKIYEVGTYKQPGMGYLQASLDGQVSELYLPNPDTVCEFNREKRNWTLSSATALGERGFDLDGVRWLSVLDMLVDPVYTGDKAEDGTACYAIKFKIDMKKYVDVKVPPSYMGIVEARASQGEGKMWIGKKDGYIRRIHYTIALSVLGVKEFSEAEWRFTGHNLPVYLPKIIDLPVAWLGGPLAMMAP